MALFPCHHWGRGQRPSQLHYLTYEVTLGVNVGQRIENTEDQVCVWGGGSSWARPGIHRYQGVTWPQMSAKESGKRSSASAQEKKNQILVSSSQLLPSLVNIFKSCYPASLHTPRLDAPFFISTGPLEPVSGSVEEREPCGGRSSEHYLVQREGGPGTQRPPAKT